MLSPNESAGTVNNLVVGPGAGDNAGAAFGLGAAPGDVVISMGLCAIMVTGHPIDHPILSVGNPTRWRM